jgi:predicted phosphatase
MTGKARRKAFPAEIIFVDDRVTNLDSVQQQLRSATFFRSAMPCLSVTLH